MEIERKWLFDMSKVPVDKAVDFIKYRQAYLSVEPEVRIRGKIICRRLDHQWVNATDEKYMICLKGNGKLSREEVQWSITSDEFQSLKNIGNIFDSDFIQKEYYEIVVDGYLLTVGTVDKETATEFSYGEIEFKSEEEALNFQPPEWFGIEVTNDDKYKMKNYWHRTRGDKND